MRYPFWLVRYDFAQIQSGVNRNVSPAIYPSACSPNPTEEIFPLPGHDRMAFN